MAYETVPRRNPKKAKIAYHVRLDSLFTFDSIAYVGFPEVPRQLIDSTAAEAVIQRGYPFNVNSLENERNRLATLFRNNGFYYYSPSFVTYLADTVNIPNRTQLRLQLSDGLPDEAMRQWYIGNVDILFRRSMREQLTDSIHRRNLHIFFNGKKPPIRPRVVLKNMRLRPRQPYSYERYQETVAKVNATGVFSALDFQFTPRDADTLDLRMSCTFDKPYDFYFESTFNGRTIGRYGPEVKLGFSRRNVFHGAEMLDVNLHGSYEWQRSGGEDMSTYQYGADVSIEFPRILAPFFDSDRVRRDKDGRPRPRRFFSTPSTLAKVSTDIVRRPDYYKMHIVSGEWTYRWQSSPQSSHEFSPLTLKYQFMNNSTEKFDTVRAANPYLLATMDDEFIPKMRYTYLYTSPSTFRNPIRWELTLEESGNGMALYDVLVQGNDWNEKEKTFFKNPYAQFVRAETDFVKTWTFSSHSSLVAHANAGVIRSFGNTMLDNSPFSERFYAGGANSIRAFTVRSVGPGAFPGIFDNRQFAYVLQNGDLKLIGNLEYRTRLFGKLGGALFLDAGNVWNWENFTFEDSDFDGPDSEDAKDVFNVIFSKTSFRLSSFAEQLAVGTGFGLRYDLGFLVVRLDWGLALHVPSMDSRSRYFFNWRRFSDGHALHFAIGYPF